MSTPRMSATIAADTALIAGIQKHLSSNTFTVLSQLQSVAQVVATLQSRVDSDQGIADAKAAYHQAVVSGRAVNAQTDAYAKDFRQTVLAMFSNSPQILADFGLRPRKAPTPLTSEEKVIAAAKRKATRAARHTAGKVQKAAIQGTLAGPVLVQEDGSSSVEPSGSATPAAPPAPPPASPPAAPPAPAVGSSGSGTSQL